MKILFLSTWFPYPLSQGSKIRAFHLLRALAEKHEVILASFADTQIEPAWQTELSKFCRRIEIIHRNPFTASPLRTVLGRFSLRPTCVLATYSREMATRVQRIASDWNPKSVVALTFVTASYALQVPNALKVIDVDNLMTYMLYEAYRQTDGIAQRLRAWLAWWKFQRYEKRLLRQFDLCLTVSDRDRQTLDTLMPTQPNQMAVVPNGVDTVYHRPGLSTPEPNTLIYNGALTYQANYDAMDYFLRDIFPLICVQLPDAHLRITGTTKGVPIERLASDGHVTFTGYIEDIRPAVAGSWVCVVPLRVGGWTRLKVLEAMALGTPVVSTSKGAEGLDVEAGRHLLIADTPREFAAQAIRVLRDAGLRKTLATNAARLVREKYDWAQIGRQFCKLLEDAMAAKQQSKPPYTGG